jgi:AraC family transcriptional regulator
MGTALIAEIHTPKVTARIHAVDYPERHTKVEWLNQEHVLVFSEKQHLGSAFFSSGPRGIIGGLGKMFLMPASVPLRFEGEGGRTRALNLCYPAAALDWDEDVSKRRPDAFWQGCMDLRSASLAAILRRASQELDEPGFAAATVIEGLGAVALVDVARQFHGGLPVRSARSGQLAPWQIRRIKEHVHAADGAAPTVGDLAALCGISRSHLHRAFRRTTGQSVYDFVQDVRLAKARALLVGTDLPLANIAALLGFASASSFTIALKRRLGEAPSQLRRRRGP